MTRITIEKIERRTDKAVLAAVEVENGAQRLGRKVWFPLSQITINDEETEMQVPAWLANAKLKDMGATGAWFN